MVPIPFSGVRNSGIISCTILGSRCWPLIYSPNFLGESTYGLVKLCWCVTVSISSWSNPSYRIFEFHSLYRHGSAPYISPSLLRKFSPKEENKHEHKESRFPREISSTSHTNVVHGRQHHDTPFLVAEVLSARSCTINDKVAEEMLELSEFGDDLWRRGIIGELGCSGNHRVPDGVGLSSPRFPVLNLLLLLVTKTMIDGIVLNLSKIEQRRHFFSFTFFGTGVWRFRLVPRLDPSTHPAPWPITGPLELIHAPTLGHVHPPKLYRV